MGIKSNLINEEITVGSSAIVTVTYCHQNNDMCVMFISGVKYLYKNVEYADFEGLRHAESCGKYFNRTIKDNYEYEIIEDNIQELA